MNMMRHEKAERHVKHLNSLPTTKRFDSLTSELNDVLSKTTKVNVPEDQTLSGWTWSVTEEDASKNEFHKGLSKEIASRFSQTHAWVEPKVTVKHDKRAKQYLFVIGL